MIFFYKNKVILMPCLMNVILKVVKGCRGVNTKLEEQIDQVLIRYIIFLVIFIRKDNKVHNKLSV